MEVTLLTFDGPIDEFPALIQTADTLVADGVRRLGIDLPERQKNEYSASLNISIPVTDTHRLKIYGERFYRLINEIPAVLLIGIVLLVVLKPF